MVIMLVQFADEVKLATELASRRSDLLNSRNFRAVSLLNHCTMYMKALTAVIGYFVSFIYIDKDMLQICIVAQILKI